MKIADNVEMLEIKLEKGVLYPILLWDKNEIILVDTGLPGQIELIKEAISQVGFSLQQITKVIITHHDMDHIGCAKILSELGSEILAYEIEVPFLQGEKTPIRIMDMERRIHDLNEGERNFYERVKQGAPQLHVKVNRAVKNNETLDYCGGITVIHTPGHMPGHMSLLLKASNTIIAGDAANIVNGILVGSNPQFTHDSSQAQASFRKIVDRNPKLVVCYHGGIYDNLLKILA